MSRVTLDPKCRNLSHVTRHKGLCRNQKNGSKITKISIIFFEPNLRGFSIENLPIYGNERQSLLLWTIKRDLQLRLSHWRSSHAGCRIEMPKILGCHASQGRMPKPKFQTGCHASHRVPNCSKWDSISSVAAEVKYFAHFIRCGRRSD
jgi:hypothetical protein